jgi:hypothetical protein
MTLTEKVAFLKGLIEGSEIKRDKKEEKIFEVLVELVDDLANAVSEIDEDVSVLYDDMDGFSEELDEIGLALYHMDRDLHDEDELDDDDFMYEIQCEKCGGNIVVDEDALLTEALVCPSCGETIELEFDCECDECCDHDKEGGCCCKENHE